jgi:Uncharacterized conserved protein
MKGDIWKIADDLNREYNSLNFNDIIDYKKYKLYSIVANLTQLEGSTLSDIDTQILLDDGLTAEGKLLKHHLMVKNNHEALTFATNSGEKKQTLSSDLLKKINSLSMADTGDIVSDIRGTVDGKTGDFRLVGAFSKALGYYLDAPEIPEAVQSYCEKFNQQMLSEDPITLLKSSFDAYLNLVFIHPWQSGNKMTSWHVMYFMQCRAELPLTKVHKDDYRLYLEALKIAKKDNNMTPFGDFMCKQHIKTLNTEIFNYKQAYDDREFLF